MSNNYNHIIIIIAIAVTMLLPGINLSAQAEKQAEVEASAEEWERFEAAYSEMETLQEELLQKEEELVENSSIDEKPFRIMYEAYLNNNKGVLSMATQDEMEEFSRVMEAIIVLQDEYRERLTQLIEESDFSSRRFYALLYEYER
ncbi:MAG: hypothetical protein ACOC2P_02195 [Spirochaetota bacterium]